jgi:hypothetical protein
VSDPLGVRMICLLNGFFNLFNLPGFMLGGVLIDFVVSDIGFESHCFMLKIHSVYINQE